MDLLPKVESEFIEEAPAPLKEEEESDDEEVEVLHESIVPEVEKKVVIPEETIFVEKKVKKELSVTPIKQDKRKRVMTEEQLERLRIGREKGLAPAPAPAPVKKSYTSLDDLPQDLLIKLQEQAIEGYDTKRKARKAKKKEAESKQSELSHFQSMVTNAVNPKQPARYGEPGFFNHLF